MTILSILIPSNRADSASIGNLIKLASLASDTIEVIIRDNSESDLKNSILANIKISNFFYFKVNYCDAYENTQETLKLASGDFIHFAADDDIIFPIFLTKSLLEIDKNKDLNVLYFGNYYIQNSQSNYIFNYDFDFEANTDIYLSNIINKRCPWYIYYSIVNSDITRFAWNFINDIPFKFSFHDQFIGLIYLVGHKPCKINAISYGYDESEWESSNKSLKKDRKFYIQNNLKGDINHFHFLIMAVEGYFLIKSNLLQKKFNIQLNTTASVWFINRIIDFININRGEYDEHETKELVSNTKEYIVNNKDKLDPFFLLKEISSIINKYDNNSAFNKNNSYYDYWANL